MHDSLFARIDAKRDDLVDLTRDLIRFPTVNPPGEAYTPCAEFLGDRLKARGFEVGYHRGEGEAGDSDRYPRTNVVARKEGARDRQHHLLAARQASRPLAPALRQHREQRAHALHVLRDGFGIAARIGADEEVLLDGERGEDLPALRALDDAGAHDPRGGEAREIGLALRPLIEDRSRLRAQQAGDRHQRRRLASPVGADQRDDLAGAHRQGDVLEHMGRAAADIEAGDLKHGRLRRGACRDRRRPHPRPPGCPAGFPPRGTGRDRAPGCAGTGA